MNPKNRSAVLIAIDLPNITYWLKALYSGEFTWMPTVVTAMYHPRYYAREATRMIKIEE